jgi:hypothetical protein
MADPAEGLEPDITVIEDEAERNRQQMEYYGGDLEDEEDNLGDLDRGDSLEPPENSDAEEEEEDDESEDTDDEAEDEAGDDSDADDADADDDSADDDDEDADDDGGDEADEPDAENQQQSSPDEDGDRGIPRRRFNEVNDRMKAAERELAELKAQQTATEDAAAEKFDFDSAEAEYMDLLLDGKTEDAGAKRREIRAAEQELFKAEAKQETIADVDQQQELRELNSLSLQAEELYPVFDQNRSEYDPVVANRVVTYMRGYMADGQPASDAFVSGLADVIQQFDLDGTATAEQEAKPEKKVTKKAPIKKTKEKVAAAKKSTSTPAAAGEGSADRGVAAPSIEDMSDADLDKLTPEQLARMRGDYVE